jgi:integrase
MAHGDGRIFLKPGSSVYHAEYWANGQRQRESTGERDEKAARRYLKNRVKQAHASEVTGATFATAAMRKLTVGDLLARLRDKYAAHGQLSPQNLSLLKKTEADLGHLSATGASSKDFAAYRQRRLSAGDAPASANRVLQMCRAAFNLAVKRAELGRAPHIELSSEAGNARQGFTDLAQLETLLAALPGDLRDFTRFGFETGWRKGEIASLTWADLDGDTIRLRGEHSKNGESRALPCVGTLGEILERRRQARQMACQFVFHRDGAPVADFKKSWATATKKAGLGGLLFHDLRRSACRGMLRAGVPMAVAMKISGHKTTSMFQRYAIVAESDLAEALTRTQNFRESARPKIVAIGKAKQA